VNREWLFNGDRLPFCFKSEPGILYWRLAALIVTRPGLLCGMTIPGQSSGWVEDQPSIRPGQRPTSASNGRRNPRGLCASRWAQACVVPARPKRITTRCSSAPPAMHTDPAREERRIELRRVRRIPAGLDGITPTKPPCDERSKRPNKPLKLIPTDARQRASKVIQDERGSSATAVPKATS
jgi:hypothetical protein